jgi:hypothetical protein
MQLDKSSANQIQSRFSRYAIAVGVLAVLQAPISQPVLAGTEITSQSLPLAAQSVAQKLPSAANQFTRELD